MVRRTIASEVSVGGTALHAGCEVRLTVTPALPGAGIVFKRSGREIPARYDTVSETRLGTVIAAGGVSIGVIEHLMSAVAGFELDDLLIVVDGPEPPILDGDARSFLDLMMRAGARESDADRAAVKVLRTVTVEQGGASCSLHLADIASYEFTIEFPSKAIGRQTYAFPFTRAGYAREIAPARTFGFLSELETLNKMNLARGASLENTLAIDGDEVVNAQLLRFSD